MRSLNGRVKRLETVIKPWEPWEREVIELMKQGKVDPADVRLVWPITCERMIAAAQLEA